MTTPLFVVMGVIFIFAWSMIERIADAEIDGIRLTAIADMRSIQNFAERQSAAFSSTSLIGYSVGRYYGFATAFAQISPEPERAAVQLRAAYGRADGAAAGRTEDLPAALLQYDAIYRRFHPGFVQMIENSLFDDLYLVDRLGRLVYALHELEVLGADLRAPKYRDLPVAEIVRAVLSRLQEAEDKSKVVVISGPRLHTGPPAVFIARPIIRHGLVEGTAIFRLPMRVIQDRLLAFETAGVRIQLLGADGTPIPGTAAAPKTAAILPLATGPEMPWSAVLVVDRGVMVGTLKAGFWAVLGMAVAAIVLSFHWFRRLTVELPGTGAQQQALEGGNASDTSHPMVDDDSAGTEATDEARHSDNNLEPDAAPSEEAFRHSLVDLMTRTLDYWQKVKGKGKIELAEESRIWRVYMDRSSLQTRTLDKYLLVETLPRNPRWRDVLRTTEYVLRHCTQPLPERDELTQAAMRLKQQLRQANRI